MIVLDTNAVPEAMKPEPAPAVRHWLDEQAVEAFYLSSVTFGELLLSIGVRPYYSSLAHGRNRPKVDWQLLDIMVRKENMPYAPDHMRFESSSTGRGR